MSIPGQVRIGSASSCDNYAEAAWLAAMLNTSEIPHGSLTASIYTNIHLHGEEYAELDLFLLLRCFPALEWEVSFADGETVPVTLSDAVVVVEVKGHPLFDRDGKPKVRFSGNNAEVRYWNAKDRCYDPWENVSKASDGQYRAANNFIRRETKVKPYTCNLILFSNLRKSDLPTYRHNFLASDSTFHDFVEKLAVSFRVNSRSQGAKPCVLTSYWSLPVSSLGQRYCEIEALLDPSDPVPTSAPVSSPAPANPSKPSHADRSGSQKTLRKVWSASYGTLGQRMSYSIGYVVAPPLAALTRFVFRSKLAFILVVAMLVPLLILYTGLLRARSGSAAAPESATALQLCSSASPGLPCTPSPTFRPGATVQVQLGPTPSSLVSLRVREPGGRVFSPGLLRTAIPLAPSGQDVSVARFTLSRRNAAGIYTVSLRLRPAGGSKERDQTLTRDFIVASEGFGGRHNRPREIAAMLK